MAFRPENQNMMERSWTEAGAAHTENKERVSAIIERMPWVTFTPGMEAPMMPGMGISSAIKELRLPKVSAVSYASHEFSPFGLYGIEAHYTNGRARVYLVDEGSSLAVICSDFWPKEAAHA